MLYYLILTSILCMTHATNTMNALKKNKNHSKQKITKTKHFCKIPAVQEFILTQQIGEQNNCPKEVINLIKQYNSILRDKAFEKIFPESYMVIWDDFSIPKRYNQLLTTEQIIIIKILFYYEPSGISCIENGIYRTAVHYSLNQKEYKKFKTIPIEIRKYLTKMPKSAKEKLKYPNPDDKINEHCILRVETKNGCKGKLIIPEEKTKKSKFDVNK